VAVTPQIRGLALFIGKVLGLEIYGIDIIETADGPYVIDVNYFPSMVGFPGAAERIADYLYCRATSACCYLRTT
jgi:ribosomal protein S6--L-glutamate ligase